jgi:hypothetical protein
VRGRNAPNPIYAARPGADCIIISPKEGVMAGAPTARLRIRLIVIAAATSTPATLLGILVSTKW